MGRSFRFVPLACAIFFVWAGYGFGVICISWPVDSLSVEKAGQLGDSFGVLNSLFSGLAMAGVLYTIFLQRMTLQNQEAQLQAMRRAEERSARLSALSQLLQSYLDDYERTGRAMQNDPKFTDEFKKIVEKKNAIVRELEGMVSERPLNSD